MSRLMMMGCGSSGPGAISTFYSQRVFDLFPQMATANSGWSTHVAEGNNIFGSDIRTDNTNDSDYIEWTVYVPAGNYKVKVEHTKTNATGRADLSVDGGAVVDTLDTYNGSTAYNQQFTSAQFTVTEGLHTIRLTKNGKNASSTGYIIAITHAQLIKQDATSALTSVANVPHVIDVPIVFADSHTNWNTIEMYTGYAFGTVLASTGAQNATVTFSFWAPKGNFTLAFNYMTYNYCGDYSVSVDGNSIGTVLGYTAGAVYLNLSTALTGTLTTTGLHTITFTMATKTAPSSNYIGKISHIQIRMTSITEPLSADLAPEVALFWPVFNEAVTGFGGVGISALQAYYNYFQSTGAQNDEMTLSTNTVLRPGTYSFAVLTPTGPGGGIYGLLLDGASVGTADMYTAGTVYNVVKTITGVVLDGLTPHSVKLKMATKNASSSAYYGQITLVRAIRTGA